MEFKQIFIRFLKEKNAYERYMFYFNSINGIRYRNEFCFDVSICSLKNFFRLSKKCYLLYAFRFRDTFEGENYWSALDKMWIELCDKIK